MLDRQFLIGRIRLWPISDEGKPQFHRCNYPNEPYPLKMLAIMNVMLHHAHVSNTHRRDA